MTSPEMVNFVVFGLPSPGGSKNAFVNKYTKKVCVVDAGGSKTKKWRGEVARSARKAMDGMDYLAPPLTLIIEFRVPRPMSHYQADGQIKSTAPWVPIVRPDVTKLLRSTEDAMTGIVWHDDAHICEQIITRTYALDEFSGARISVLTTKWKSKATTTIRQMEKFYEGKQSLENIEKFDNEAKRLIQLDTVNQKGK